MKRFLLAFIIILSFCLLLVSCDSEETRGEQGPQGIQGEPGATPYIGENGNWWVGETDTGVRAIAPDDALSEAEVVALIDSKLSSITNAEEVAY